MVRLPSGWLSACLPHFILKKPGKLTPPSHIGYQITGIFLTLSILYQKNRENFFHLSVKWTLNFLVSFPESYIFHTGRLFKILSGSSLISRQLNDINSTATVVRVPVKQVTHSADSRQNIASATDRPTCLCSWQNYGTKKLLHKPGTFVRWVALSQLYK